MPLVRVRCGATHRAVGSVRQGLAAKEGPQEGDAEERVAGDEELAHDAGADGDNLPGGHWVNKLWNYRPVALH